MMIDFTKEKYDIVVQAGQSNSEGCGFGSADQPYEQNENVWYMNDSGLLENNNRKYYITCAADNVWGNELRSDFSLSFAREYIAAGLLAEGRKLLILRTAVGGTGFLDNRWNMTGDLYQRMIDMTHTALSLNKENRLVGWLWHQGETDALLNASYETHYDNLKRMVSSFRAEFDVPNLMFLAGNFTPLWRKNNETITEPVIRAIRAVCRDLQNCGFVETEGLLSNIEENHRIPEWENWIEDDIHFSRNSLYKLGKRYFELYQNMKASL